MFQPNRRTLRQSKPLPYWVWFLIAKFLGIKTHPKDKPWFATILYCITLTSVLTYFVTTTWYVVYDIYAINTKYDVLNGTITLAMALGYSAISLYANKLAYKLFTNHIFLQSVRLHSKTVLSVNASLLIAVMGVLFLALYSVHTYDNFKDAYCTKVGLTPWICHFRWPSQLGLSVTAFGWNAMVAVIMLSVCRTHTISIRHFILILEEDSLVYELKRSKPVTVVDGATSTGAPTPTDLIPPDICIDGEDADLKHLEEQWDQSEIQRRRRSVSSHFHSLHVSSTTSIQNTQIDGASQHQEVFNTSSASECQAIPQTLDWLNTSCYIHTPMSDMLGNDEILDKYWKLQSRLQTTSMVLQRWITSWIVLILFWSTYYLLYWIDHNATILDMILFFIPLILLPVLCSGPTEVNGEGQRVPMSIVPTEERLRLIAFIKQSSLSITIFGFELNYSTIVTTMAAIALAFATKVIITNIQVTPTPTPTGSSDIFTTARA